MNRGFGDGMSRAFELVATPLVFAGLGFLVDSLVGTSPAFLAGFAVFGVVGVFVRAWIGYDQEMRSHEATGAWVRRADRPDVAGTQTAGEVDIWAASRPADLGAPR